MRQRSGLCHFKQYGIKIISAQLADAAACDDRVIVTRQPDRGAIESTAAQVVDQQVFPLARHIFGPIAMRVLDAGGGRFIEDTDNAKAGETETFDGKKTLIAVGIRGYP